jgi:intron-binding protein aquarius
MVVGPPGTGKTDVAVQIISALYHNNPTQKILLVTHSNAALNDLFEKIMERNVDPRHLLRLGSGEKDLRETLAASGAGGGGRGQGEAFSKQGRVDWTLMRRMQLLEQVQRLAGTIGVTGDVGYTCETAEYFRLEHIQSRIEKYHMDVTASMGTSAPSVPPTSAAQRAFPFANYFSDTPKPVFTGDEEGDLASAEGCFRHISKLFEELNDYRAFELLRTQGHRSDYLLTKQVQTLLPTLHPSLARFKLIYHTAMTKPVYF